LMGTNPIEANLRAAEEFEQIVWNTRFGSGPVPE
jgi:hypothetical protein